MAGDVSFSGELDNNLTQEAQTQYIAKVKVNNYPYPECNVITFHLDSYDYFKWQFVARPFGYLYPKRHLHKKALEHLKNSYGKTINITLATEPKEIGKCEFLIDGMEYHKHKDKDYIDFYYNLSAP